MWLFTTRGFFSVVQKWDNPEQVQVRARIGADLDALREVCPDLSPTMKTTTTDYPYRAIVGKYALGVALQKLVIAQLDYTNFKAEVEKKQGRPREELYARVWSVMHGAEEKLKPRQLDEGPADLDWKPVEKRQNKTVAPKEKRAKPKRKHKGR
jgi:hypothetical protein